MPHNLAYEFGPFRLDLNKRVLMRAGETISLAPKDVAFSQEPSGWRKVGDSDRFRIALVTIVEPMHDELQVAERT